MGHVVWELLLQKREKTDSAFTWGGQEHNWRSTTENLAGIAATSKALRLALDDDDFKRQKVRAMKQVILEELEKHRKVHVFSKVENFAPNILTFGIRGVRGEVVVHAFEQHEIYISTTSACSSRKMRRLEL